MTRNKRFSDAEFWRQREEVLAEWPTGKEATDLNEAIAYHKTLPPTKNSAKKLVAAKQKGVPLVRIDTGRATLEEQMEHFRHVQDEGSADLLATLVDSLTRTHRFKAAGQAITESLKIGKSVLNGFPVVNHGVSKTRKLLESVALPVELRANAPDFRLATEIGLAAGHTAVASGPLINFWEYSKDLPLETTINNWQYVYRLVGYYEERGIPMVAAPPGGVPVLVPPSLIVAAQIVESLIAAEQGVKNIQHSNWGQGNLVQDIATIISLPKLSEAYFNRFGYKDVVTTVYSQYWGQKYPLDWAQALGVISMSPIIAVLGGAQIAQVKAFDEAETIPAKENAAATVRFAKMVINLLKEQKLELSSQALAAEIEMLGWETKAIVDRVIDLGDGDVAIGAIKAVELGVLDWPYSTTRYVANKVMGVRDGEGAVRWLDHGNLPFTKDIIEFHKEKIAQRAKKLGGEVDYQTIIDDIMSISRGFLLANFKSGS